MEITIVRKKIGFIKKSKLLVKVNNFWNKFPEEDREKSIGKLIMKDVSLLDELESITHELIKQSALEIIVNGEKYSDEKQMLQLLDDAESPELFIGIFTKLIESITPKDEKLGS